MCWQQRTRVMMTSPDMWEMYLTRRDPSRRSLISWSTLAAPLSVSFRSAICAGLLHYCQLPVYYLFDCVTTGAPSPFGMCTIAAHE